MTIGSRVYAVGGWKKFGGVQVALESLGAMSTHASCAGLFPLNPIGLHYCSATASSVGIATTLHAFGSTSVGDADLLLEAAPVPDQPGVFFYGPNQIEVPFGDGFRCVGGNVTRLGVTWGQNGALRSFVDFGEPGTAGAIQAGSTLHFQAWYRDPQGGGQGFNLSNGYTISFLP